MQKINTLEQSTFNGSTEKEEPMKRTGKEMPKSQEKTETKNEGNNITNHKRDQGSWGKNLVDCSEGDKGECGKNTGKGTVEVKPGYSSQASIQ